MGEKGGKGFSLPSKEAYLKGKDDSSTKSKRVRKQFSFEGSTEAKINFSSSSGGKGDIPTAKVGLGKGDSTGKSVKKSVSKEPLQLNMEQELPTNAKCLMDCEAAYILQGIQEQMVVLSEDATIKIPVSFKRALSYTRTGSEYTDPRSVRGVLGTLAKYGVSDGEICVIANVCPETVEEVFALVPSLKPKRIKLIEPLKVVLSDLAKLKNLTGKPRQMQVLQ